MKRTALLLALASAAIYAAMGLLALDPRTLFTLDAAIKILQARALIASGGHSLAIAYPAATLDPAARFFPFIPAFVFEHHGIWQAVFPAAVAVLNTPWLLMGGVGGMVLASSLGGGATIGMTSTLDSTGPRWVPAVLLGVGTYFWFYAVLPWEHIPAVALSTAAWVLLCRDPASAQVVAAGFALGVAAALREESLLLLPGMLWIISRRRPFIRRWLVFLIALSVPVIAFLFVDVSVFGRPPAMHLGHVAALAASELKTATDVHRQATWSFAHRYDVLVHDWLLGREGLLYSSLVVALLLTLVGLRRHGAAAIGVLTMCILMLVQLSQDLSLYLQHPGFPVGLLRLSPVLIFAALPAAPGAFGSPVRRSALVSSGCYLAVLLMTLNLSGGPGLGPRFLLPILPMLCVAACECLWSYRRHPGRSGSYWPVWEIGIILLAGSVCIQVAIGMRAYVTFNQAERRAVEALDEAADNVIVLDDPRTMSVVGSVYLRKLVMLADTPPRATSLTDTLRRGSVRSFLMVSRADRQTLTFQPFQLISVDRFGKTTIQHWRLPEPALR